MSFDTIPLWAFLIGTFLIVMGSLEGGYRLGRSVHRRSDDEKESPVSVISGSVLGLGAFILAFTFGIVANRFDYRRELVREDANAIRTTWQRSEFLPEPERTEAKRILRQYLDARLELAQSQLEPERLESFNSTVDRDQRRLWEKAVVEARKDMNSDVAALYIESLNELFSVHALRVAVAIQSRIPGGFWLVLFILTALGMLSLGYQTGIAGSKRSLAQPILAVAFALVIGLIAELDRPTSGIVRVAQQPLIDLQTWMSKESGLAGAAGIPPAVSVDSKSVAPTPNASEP